MKNNQSNHDIISTHWGRATHTCKCVGNLTTISSDNGLAPGGRQAIIWNNDGVLSIGTLETKFCEILIGIQTFSFKKCIWKYRLDNGVIFFDLNVLSKCCKMPKLGINNNKGLISKWHLHCLYALNYIQQKIVHWNHHRFGDKMRCTLLIQWYPFNR